MIVLSLFMGVIWTALLVVHWHLSQKIFTYQKNMFRITVDNAVDQTFRDLSVMEIQNLNSQHNMKVCYLGLHRDSTIALGRSRVDPAYDFIMKNDQIAMNLGFLMNYAMQNRIEIDFRDLGYQTIDSVLHQNMSDYGISEPYQLGFWCGADAAFIHISPEADQDILRNQGFHYSFLCVSENGITYSDRLFLFFPELVFPKQWDIIAGFVIFVLMMLIMLCCFIGIISIVIRQRKVNEFRERMVYSITHELKTPLTTINLASQLLQDNTVQKDQETTESYLKMITAETISLRDLVEEVLSVYREDMAPVKEKHDVSIHELLRNVVNVHQLALNECHATVSLELNAERDVVRGVQTHLFNAFSNLIDNAIKYRNGDLKLLIATRNVGNMLEISVSDNGIGIEKKYQKLIFEPFARVNTDNAQYVKGYGIGLSYVGFVVNYHNGTIKVESELHKGANFIVYLPIK